VGLSSRLSDPSRRGHARWTVICVAVSLLAASCTGDGAVQTTGGTGPAVTSTTTPSATDPPPAPVIPVEVFEDVLVASGVTILDGPDGEVLRSPGGPVGPLMVTSFQAESLLRLAESGAGLSGSEIDALLGEPVPGVALSQMIADSLASGGSAGAGMMRDLMGPQLLGDPAAARFPAAALLVFVADLIGPGGNPIRSLRASVGPGAGPVTPPPHPGGAVEGDGARVLAAGVPGPIPGECSFVAGWVSTVVMALLDMAPDSLTRQGWSSVFVPGLTDALVVLALLALLAPIVAGRGVTLSADPEADRYAVGAEPDRPQVFTATLTPLGEWPEHIRLCASAATGLILPDLTGRGTPADWTVLGFPAHGVEVSREQTFDEAGQARLHWITAREETDEGTTHVANVTALVDVDGEFRATLIEVFVDALAKAVFPPDQVALLAYITNMRAEIETALFDLTTSSASVEVMFHATCPVGSWVSVRWEVPNIDTAYGAGTMIMRIDDAGNGLVEFDPEFPLYAIAEQPGAILVRMVFSGTYSFRLGTAFGSAEYLGGDATMTAHADIGGQWVQTAPPIDLVEGGVGHIGSSVFACQDDQLVVISPVAPGGRILFIPWP
jgi:hypothetical protein